MKKQKEHVIKETGYFSKEVQEKIKKEIQNKKTR